MATKNMETAEMIEEKQIIATGGIRDAKGGSAWDFIEFNLRRIDALSRDYQLRFSPECLVLSPFGIIATTLVICSCALMWVRSSPSADYANEAY
jgi:hypothetical protein